MRKPGFGDLALWIFWVAPIIVEDSGSRGRESWEIWVRRPGSWEIRARRPGILGNLGPEAWILANLGPEAWNSGNSGPGGLEMAWERGPVVKNPGEFGFGGLGNLGPVAWERGPVVKNPGKLCSGGPGSLGAEAWNPESGSGGPETE